MSSKTVHKFTTPHGLETPHKDEDLAPGSLDVLSSLTIQLYPTGRAFYQNEGSVFKSFNDAINASFFNLITDAKNLINANLPDNALFLEEDAELWEYRLGLPTNSQVSLDLRKSAIRRKMGHPNNVKARQGSSFIQDQLNQAGFNVFIHENTSPYRSPLEVTNAGVSEVQHGGTSQHSNTYQHGGDGFDVIANSIEAVEIYTVSEAGLWATFFIGGLVLGTVAEVPSSRLKEFKELVIKLKPAHTVAFTFLNYT
jgi:hypothetical protein